MLHQKCKINFFAKYFLLFSTKADGCWSIFQVPWFYMERILAMSTNLLHSTALFCHKYVFKY